MSSVAAARTLRTPHGYVEEVTNLISQRDDNQSANSAILHASAEAAPPGLRKSLLAAATPGADADENRPQSGAQSGGARGVPAVAGL